MRSLVPVLLAAAAPLATAQSNVVAGRDGRLEDIRKLSTLGHAGTYPTGRNGVALGTQVCNVGSSAIPWHAAMNEDHPFIAFLVARERNGRLEQISDRSHVKHVWYASNLPGGCGSCGGGPTYQLDVGCSDVYGVQINGDNYWLGPPGEIDPWLGSWTAQCSLFDRGEPPVAASKQCDGIRSFSTSQAAALGKLGHRVRIDDADLDDPAASYACQAHFVVSGELESLRGDDLGWRRFDPVWSPPNKLWLFNLTSPLAHGSILSAWSGASVGSARDGAQDGRVFAGVATGPGSCATHYEVALHNRDHAAGIETLRIPLAHGATVTAAGMSDLDDDPTNDWSAARIGDELVFRGPGNPVGWNSIFNFWFDCDAVPVPGAVVVGAGGGAPSFSIPGLEVPAGPYPLTCAVYCTAGTSAAGCRARVSASGFPSATAPSGFVLAADDVEGGRDGFFLHGTGARVIEPWGNGTSSLCFAPPASRGALLGGNGTALACDGSFTYDLNARWAALPQQNPGAGAVVRSQFWYRDPKNTSHDKTSLSDAVEFTVGH